MIQRMVLGVLGGALIVLSVFMVGNSVAFDSGVPDSGAAWVVVAAGALVALFAIVGVRTLIGFGAGAAAAVGAAEIYDLARAGDFSVTTRLVVLAAGILAALAATTGRRRARAVAEPEPVVEPVVVTPVVAAPVVAAPVAVTSEEPLAPKKPAKRAKAATTSAQHKTAENTTAEHTTAEASIPR